jgi:hypothetical protein
MCKYPVSNIHQPISNDGGDKLDIGGWILDNSVLFYDRLTLVFLFKEGKQVT